MKSVILIAAVAAALAVGACRSECCHEPLKLGGPVAEQAK
jgi:hypothetical protein